MCAENKQNCSRAADNTGICTDCVATFAHNVQTDTCYCPDQTAWNQTANACDTCPSGCNACSNSTFCTECKSTYIHDLTSGTCGCNATSIDNNGAGCQKLSDCPDGQYNPGDNTCVACDPGCSLCDMLTGRCNQCDTANGYELLAGYCNKWRRLSEEIDEYGSCGSGCRECNGAQCLKCEQGMVQSKTNKR